MQITLSYPTRPHRNSVRASQVMDYFGIGPDSADRIIADQLEIPIQTGDVVLFTGPSGSGKSSLLNAVVQRIENEASPRRRGGTPAEEQESSSKCQEEGPGVRAKQPAHQDPDSNLCHSVPPCLRGQSASYPIIKLAEQDFVSHSLVDAIPLPFEETLQLLSMCGLGEAPLLLRTPQELSEGQRYRFLIALAAAQRPRWIVADEFTAVLDRTTAKVIAYNVRRLADRFGIGFLLATAMDDVAEDLQPNLLVQCDLDGRVGVSRKISRGPGTENLSPDDTCDQHPAAQSPWPMELSGGLTPSNPSGPQPLSKKKDRPSLSIPNCGSVSPPNPTGRISLGGIIAATRSA